MKVPQAGELISDRYRLTEALGKGAMGAVWLAEHVSLGTPVAIKLIHQSTARNRRSVARFEREAVLAAQIESAHVVRIVDHGHHDGLPFIVMDPLRGEDLRERLMARGRLNLDETRALIRDTCRALTAAHRLGLVHRDIKPENIFLAKEQGEERAVVLDFGVAKATDTIADAAISPTRTGTVIGTPYYLSPEQALGLKTVGPASDFWALAVVAFECLTGERPFHAQSMGPLIAAITEGPIPTPSEVLPRFAPALDAWFRTAMARDPAARHGDAVEMSQAFDAACRQSTEPSTTASVPQAADTVVLPDGVGATVSLEEAADVIAAARVAASEPNVPETLSMAPEPATATASMPPPQKGSPQLSQPAPPQPALPRLAPPAQPSLVTKERDRAMFVFGISIGVTLMAVAIGVLLLIL